MRGVHAAQRQRRARHRARLLVGAGVRVGAGGRRRLVALRVGRDGDGLVRRVQVRHRRQGPGALAVVRHLYARYSPQQAEARAARHHLRARARGECPRARTLPPVRGTRLCAHRDSVTQNSHLSRTKTENHDHTREPATAPAEDIVRHTIIG